MPFEDFLCRPRYSWRAIAIRGRERGLTDQDRRILAGAQGPSGMSSRLYRELKNVYMYLSLPGPFLLAASLTGRGPFPKLGPLPFVLRPHSIRALGTHVGTPFSSFPQLRSLKGCLPSLFQPEQTDPLLEGTSPLPPLPPPGSQSLPLQPHFLKDGSVLHSHSPLTFMW